MPRQPRAPQAPRPVGAVSADPPGPGRGEVRGERRAEQISAKQKCSQFLQIRAFDGRDSDSARLVMSESPARRFVPGLASRPANG